MAVAADFDDAGRVALANVRDGDAAARQALVFGLVGEGVGVEFLTWAEHADLPDPAAVVADPSIVDWTGRADCVGGPVGRVGWAASAGTVEAWRLAWCSAAGRQPKPVPPNGRCRCPPAGPGAARPGPRCPPPSGTSSSPPVLAAAGL